MNQQLASFGVELGGPKDHNTPPLGAGKFIVYPYRANFCPSSPPPGSWFYGGDNYCDAGGAQLRGIWFRTRWAVIGIGLVNFEGQLKNKQFLFLFKFINGLRIVIRSSDIKPVTAMISYKYVFIVR